MLCHQNLVHDHMNHPVLTSALPGPTLAPGGSSSPEAESSPYIYCPPDVVRDLPGDAAKTFVRIPQPKTNVNWDGPLSVNN